MRFALAASTIGNALTVAGWVGCLSTGGLVVLRAVKKDNPVLVIPWWWWIANAGSLSLVAAGNSGWVQGACVDVAFVCGGIGLAELANGVKSGAIRLRRMQEPSSHEWEANQDFISGTKGIHIIEVMGRPELQGGSPHIDFTVTFISSNLHQGFLLPEVKGHVRAPNPNGDLEELTHLPELIQLEREDSAGISFSSSQVIQGEVEIRRGVKLRLTMRQHVVPEVRDTFRQQAGGFVTFNLASVDVGVE